MRKFLCGTAPARAPFFTLSHYLPQIKTRSSLLLTLPAVVIFCNFRLHCRANMPAAAIRALQYLALPLKQKSAIITDVNQFCFPLGGKMQAVFPRVLTHIMAVTTPQCRLLNYSYVAWIVKKNVISVSFFRFLCNVLKLSRRSLPFYLSLFMPLALPLFYPLPRFFRVHPVCKTGVYGGGRAGRLYFSAGCGPQCVYLPPKTWCHSPAFWCIVLILALFRGFLQFVHFFEQFYLLQYIK